MTYYLTQYYFPYAIIKSSDKVSDPDTGKLDEFFRLRSKTYGIKPADMGLDTVELIVSTEKHFNISIPDPEAATLQTVQDIADCVYSKLQTTPETWRKKDVEKAVIDIVSECSGIPADEIRLEHRMTSDLGLD